MKNKILITGVAGYIGSALAEVLKKNYHIVGIDNLSKTSKKYIPKEVEFYKISTLDTRALEKLFKQNDFYAVIHLAAYKSVSESEEFPEKYIQNNLAGTANLLRFASDQKVEKFVFSSTAALYKETKDCIPYKENSPIEPANVYGFVKLKEEELIQKLYEKGRLKSYTIFRYFNVAGDAGLGYMEKEPENVLPILAQKIKKEETFTIFGKNYKTKDGTPVRDYIHLLDLAQAHKRALLKRSPAGIYNLGTGKGVSVLELIKEFKRQIGKDIQYSFGKKRPGDLPCSVADYSLAKLKLGWKPKYYIKDIARDVINLYKLKNNS